MVMLNAIMGIAISRNWVNENKYDHHKENKGYTTLADGGSKAFEIYTIRFVSAS